MRVSSLGLKVLRVSQPGTSGGGQVQTLRPVGREEVIWGPAVEKLSVCD